MTGETRSNPKYRFYGRRTGRKPKESRAQAMAELMPKHAIILGNDDTPLDPTTLFDFPVTDVWLEIGFGNGEHLIQQAKLHPTVGFIGAEPFMPGVSALMLAMKTQNVKNIRVLTDDVRPLLDALAPQSIGRCFLLHSDPWPKKRHHERRVIQTKTLDTIARLLKRGAEFRVSSDDVGLAEWSLDKIWHHAAFEWTARKANDWRIRPADWFETRYENKGLAHNRPPYYLRFVRN